MTIVLYTWNTPNGQKIPIFFEEAGLPYDFRPINIGRGEQKQPEYLAINPNGRIPAIVDPEGAAGQPLAVFESGAILLYLAEKYGVLLPSDPSGRWRAIAWTFFQVGGIGPMFGQVGYFSRSAPDNTQAIERFTNEAKRLLGVLELGLADSEYLASSYSIADIAIYPWMRAHRFKGYEFLEAALADTPNVQRWLAAIEARPAVQRALTLTAERCALPNQ